MVRKRSSVRIRLEAFQRVRVRPLGQAVKTPPFHGGNTGSNPVGVTIIILCELIGHNRLRRSCGGLAQLGEHLPYKQRVGGSSPSSSTIIYSRCE